MTGVPSLLGALGMVAIVFAMVSFLLIFFGAPTNLGWILGNLILGLILLGSAVAMSLDSLRERLSSGEARRASRYGTSAIVQMLLFVAILGMLGFLATRYSTRFDWSEAKVHSLSDQSRKVLGGLERDVEVVGLFSPLDAPPVRDLLQRYEHVSERFVVEEFADPNARPDLLQRFAIAPEQLGNGVLRIALGDESTLVQEITEENITNAMVKLSRTGQRVVYFLEGHNERAIDGEKAAEKDSFARAADALRNENYAVEKLLLAAQGEVPEDADAVVVAGATRPLLRQEHAALDRYLSGGGAMLVMIDPRANTDLVETVGAWGVEVGDDIIVDRQLALFGRATTPFAGKYDPDHEITRDLRDTTLFHVARSVRAGEGAELAFSELVFTGEDSWAERDLDRFFAEGAAELDDIDLKGPVPVAVAGLLEVGNGTPSEGEDAGGAAGVAARLAVFGDADFASNELIEAYRNRDLFLNTVNWLLGDVEAISIRPVRSRASRFQPTAEQFETIRLLSLFVVPQLLAVVGVFVWWSRRNPSGR